MLTITKLSLLHQTIRQIHKKNQRVALVPTMGCLHDGHMKLIETAKIYSDVIIVSTFVNPMQFDRIDDFIRYPRTFKEDCNKLHQCKYINFLFSPTQYDFFPDGIQNTTYVDVPNISTILEGENRPKHFRGVATVISKLFNLIRPHIAVFGEKDYQQLMLIKKMISEMNYNIEIIGVPISRDKDGLALSSRNIYLTTEQRKIAPMLNKILILVADYLRIGNLKEKEIISIAEKKLNEIGFLSSRIYIRDANTLLEITSNSRHAVILLSAWLGQTRLIDNKVVHLKNKK